MQKLCFLLAILTSFAFGAFAPANRPYDAQSYRLRLTIDPTTDPKDFKAEALVRLKTKEKVTQIVLDIEDLKIQKIVFAKSWKNIDFKTTDKLLTMTFPKPIRAGELMEISIVYLGKIHTDKQTGLFRTVDPDDKSRGPLLFTHFEALSARSFFPCNDEPYDKATTEVQVMVPIAYEAISNGKKVMDRRFDADGKTWHEVRWSQSKPHSTYLLSLAIAPLAKVINGSDKPEVASYVSPKKKDRAKYTTQITQQALRFFEGYLGVPYPWAKYDAVGIPGYLWGGMENISTTHMNEDRMLLNDPNSEMEKQHIVGLAAHELAHQWFGNLVTMKWWDNVWLNEAFASYMQDLAVANIFKNDQLIVATVTNTWDHYFREENGPRSHPIVDGELASAEDAFDSTNYTKGAAILRMLNFYLGAEKFKKGVNNYLKTYAYGNANHLDFFDAMEKGTGENLKAFRDSWLLKSGYPVVKYGGEWDSSKSNYKLTLNQRPNRAEQSYVFDFKLPVVFHRKTAPAYAKEIVVKMTQGDQSESISLPDAPEWVTINPGAVVLAKVVQTEKEDDKLALQALNDTDPVARVWAAYELGQPIVSGEKISNFAQNTLASVLNDDPSPYVRMAILDLAHRTKARWLPSDLGSAIHGLARIVSAKEYATSALFLSDPHGWAQFRSSLISQLGHIEKEDVVPFLVSLLSRKTLGLDEVGAAAGALATFGDPKTPDMLRTALKTHQDRGYRYESSILFAFAAFQSPAAAKEIQEIAKTAGADIIGRIGWTISDNQVLKNSVEWAQFLKDFILNNTRFGDDVKTRLLRTVEEVKSPEVKEMLETLAKKSASDRIKEACRKMLKGF